MSKNVRNCPLQGLAWQPRGGPDTGLHRASVTDAGRWLTDVAEPSVLIVETERHALRSLLRDLFYGACTDTTLHPSINLHAGRMWPVLNYVKRWFQ